MGGKEMERFESVAQAARQAMEQTATAALVLSLRGAIIVVLSFALLALRMWRRV
jgi:hypothetical protein